LHIPLPGETAARVKKEDMSVQEKEPVEAHDVVKATQDVDSNSSEKGTASPVDSADIDPAAERRLLWKLDLTIYPILYVVYMMSFLDRINISNARIQNLGDDIDLTGNKFNIALFVSCPTRPAGSYSSPSENPSLLTTARDP